MIKIDDITLGYRGRGPLLEHASAQVEAGSLVGLIGRNGTGKSTLLRAIAGHEQLGAGRITIAGLDSVTMTHSQRARTIAFVNTQRVRIANLRCRDLVALGRAPYTDWLGRLGKHDMDIVDSALASVGMADYATRCMDSMSDGECQRIMIARALAQDTPAILLDEPTSFLDIPNRHQLVRLLRQLAHQQQKTILFSTHELDIALKLCDSIMLIDSPTLLTLPAAEMAESPRLRALFALS